MTSSKIKTKFVIICEDEDNNIFAARTWEGTAREGIDSVRADAAANVFGRQVIDIWAIPASTK